MRQRARTGVSGTSSARSDPRRISVTLPVVWAAALVLAALLDPQAAFAQGAKKSKSAPFTASVKDTGHTPSQPQPGQSVTLKLTVATAGGGAQPVSWRIMVGSGPRGNPVLLGEGVRRGVSAGTTFEQTVTWQAVPGTHTFRFEVDPRHTLNEPSGHRTDNIRTRTITIARTSTSTKKQPFTFKAKDIDLIPPQPQEGQSVTVRFTVETAGAGTMSLPWRIAVGSGSRSGANLILLGEGVRSNVAAGSTFEQTATWQATAGTHTFRADVDPQHTLNEPSGHRTDNVRIGTITVVAASQWRKWGNAAWSGARSGINAWQAQAKLRDVRINGPVASGGQLIGPGIQNAIRGEMQRSGAPNDAADRFAAAVAEAWTLWHEAIAVPNLPWYPAFAAVAARQAPPTPNVPTSLAALRSAQAGQLEPGALAARIRSKLGAAIMSQSGAAAAVDDFVKTFTERFAAWVASVQVRNALGEGPVPTFAPPRVPAGPVRNGSVRPTTGVIASQPF